MPLASELQVDAVVLKALAAKVRASMATAGCAWPMRRRMRIGSGGPGASRGDRARAARVAVDAVAGQMRRYGAATVDERWAA